MSDAFINLYGFMIADGLRLLGVLVLALLLLRLLRGATNALVAKPAAPGRTAQQRQEQTAALAQQLYSAGSKVIWAVAVLTALPEFGISAWPSVVLVGSVLLAIGFGGRDAVRDVMAGFCIVFEDQYAVGDTIQAGQVAGRVEQLTLRRTVVRDARGALVTLANGVMHTVSNLSRDWSQAFVDIAIAAEIPLEKSLQAVEAAAAELRGDASWSPALVDGPRVLGVQGYDRGLSTLRVQVRTAPTRQDEVCRELRRRIQLQFERRGVQAAGSGPGEGSLASRQ
jgi:moderate conductance mechanosensitive channel